MNLAVKLSLIHAADRFESYLEPAICRPTLSTPKSRTLVKSWSMFSVNEAEYRMAADGVFKERQALPFSLRSISREDLRRFVVANQKRRILLAGAPTPSRTPAITERMAAFVVQCHYLAVKHCVLDVEPGDESGDLGISCQDRFGCETGFAFRGRRGAPRRGNRQI